MNNPATELVVKDGVEYGCAWVYGQKTLDAVYGSMMSIIEVANLPENQEKAMKSEIRKALYRPTLRGVFLTAEEFAEIGSTKGLKGAVESPVPSTILTT